MTDPTDTPPSPLVTAALAVGLALCAVLVVWLGAHFVPAAISLTAAALARLPEIGATLPMWTQTAMLVTAVALLVWVFGPWRRHH